MNGGSYATYAYGAGNPISNMDRTGDVCTSGGAFTLCGYPDGPTFVIPTPNGFPDYLGPVGNFFSYHKYDIQVALGCADPNAEFSAASLGRLTDGLALIVCAAHALRSIEDMGADVAAVRSTLRQGIVQAQQAASALGLDLMVSYGADQDS